MYCTALYGMIVLYSNIIINYPMTTLWIIGSEQIGLCAKPLKRPASAVPWAGLSLLWLCCWLLRLPNYSPLRKIESFVADSLTD
jgi:hypothetical protein